MKSKFTLKLVELLPFLFVLISLCITIPALWQATAHAQTKKFVSVAGQQLSNELIPGFAKGTTIRQSFLAAQGVYDSVGVRMAANQQADNLCELTLQLFREEQVLRTSTRPCSSIVDNEYVFFEFEPISTANNQEYSFTITSTGNPQNELVIYRYTSTEGNFLMGNAVAEGSLTYVVGTQTSQLVDQQAMLYVSLTFLILGFLFAWVWSKLHLHPLRLTFFSLYSIGLLFLLIIPPFQYLDERDHFMRALELSYFDFSSAKYGSFQTAPEYPEVVYRTLWQNDSLSGGYGDEIQSTFDIRAATNRSVKESSSAAGAIPIAHLVPALAILIGRTLGLPIIMHLYLARLAMLSLFALIVVFTVRLSPKNYLAWIAVGILPTVISQAASLSLDSLITGSVIVLAALLASSHKLTKLSFIIVCGIAIILSLFKYPYLPFGILLIGVAAKKHYTLTKSIIISVIFGSIMLLLIFGWSSFISSKMAGDQRFAGTDASYQINLIRTTPLIAFTLIASSAIKQFPEIIIESSQRLFNNYSIGRFALTSWGFVFSTLVIFVLSSSIKYVNKKTYVVFILVSLIVAALIHSAMFISATVIKATLVLVPPRYYSFLWPILLLGFSIIVSRLKLEFSIRTIRQYAFGQYLFVLTIAYYATLSFLVFF